MLGDELTGSRRCGCASRRSGLGLRRTWLPGQGRINRYFGSRPCGVRNRGMAGQHEQASPPHSPADANQTRSRASTAGSRASARTLTARCSGCGQVRSAGSGTLAGPFCRGCTVPAFPDCAARADGLRPGQCARCRLELRLRELPTGPDNGICPSLGPLEKALAATDPARDRAALARQAVRRSRSERHRDRRPRSQPRRTGPPGTDPGPRPSAACSAPPERCRPATSRWPAWNASPPA